METKVIMIETVTAAAGDLVLTGDGTFAIAATSIVKLKNPGSKLSAKVASAAAVATVKPVTLTYAADTDYAFNITQKMNGENFSKTISSSTKGGVLNTQALLNADIIAKIVAYGFDVTTGSSGAIVTITGAAGNEFFTASAIQNCSVGAGTDGSIAIGDYADVLARGGSPVVGMTYDRYDAIASNPSQRDGGSTVVQTPSGISIFVNNTTDSAKAVLFAGGWLNVSTGKQVAAGVVQNKASLTAAAGTSVAALATAINLQAGIDNFDSQTAT